MQQCQTRLLIFQNRAVKLLIEKHDIDDSLWGITRHIYNKVTLSFTKRYTALPSYLISIGFVCNSLCLKVLSVVVDNIRQTNIYYTCIHTYPNTKTTLYKSTSIDEHVWRILDFIPEIYDLAAHVCNKVYRLKAWYPDMLL